MLPRFEVVTRLRPVAVVGLPTVVEEYDDGRAGERPTQAGAPTPHPAPYAAVEVDLAPDPPAGVLMLEIAGADGSRLAITLDTGSGAVGLEVGAGGETSHHRSRRHGRAAVAPSRVGLALTGTHLAALTEEDGRWVVRGRVGLGKLDQRRRLDQRIDTRDLVWLNGLRSGWTWVSGVSAGSTNGAGSSHGANGGSPVTRWRAGSFGQLGLRDLRVVTNADGTPYRPSTSDDDPILFSATSAGPGFFDTAHTSVWSLGTRSLTLRHLSDLYFERADRPGGYGDHAGHVVRDGDRWLVATSTWGDFHGRRKGATVGVTLAETTADLLAGRHRLPTRPLPLPTDGFRSVGVWDPHLVHTGTEWLVGYVSARRFFRFHPVLAAGPDLDRLTLRAAAPGRSATEGTTILRVGDHWRVLASDGRDGPRAQRARYPVLDTDLRDLGQVAAPYPTNIPWPTLVPPGDDEQDWLLVTFNGRPYGGPLPGYGTHGDVVVMRPRA